MNNPVEIEFAVNLNKQKNDKIIFNILQIRPIVDNDENTNIDLQKIKNDETIISSMSALGNGEIKDIYDIVYVKPDSFDSLKTHEIAKSIEVLNNKFLEEKTNYILIGPGRWGSNDPNLGIPIKWPQISATRVIVESGMKNYRIDPSQGTHFFQNLTSFKIGYFTINPFINDGYYDIPFLSAQKPSYEDEFIRHIRFSKPINVKINGRKNTGIIMKPK